MDHPEASAGNSLTSLMEQFLWVANRLAAPLLKPFGPSSEPTSIDEDDIDKLKQRLDRIRAAIRDAEGRDIKDESVKLWLSELRELEYGAENILEVFEFESLRTTRLEELRVELVGAGKRKREVSLLSSDRHLNCLGRKIRMITDRFKDMAFDRNALQLTDADGERRSRGTLPQPPTSSFVAGEFHGRKDEMEKLVGLLISDVDVDSGRWSRCAFPVIPVVGMGGVGKTALVQHAYNDDRVNSYFNLKVWVCTSAGFDVTKATKAIIEYVTEKPCLLSELNQLQENVAKLLKGKRFLLVIDDLWSYDDHWESLQGPLKSAELGSKIVVTTRNRRVAKTLPAICSSYLNCLSDSDSWLIFKQHAFDGRDPDQYPYLMQIGKRIVPKCKGLPLAAKALGCLLRAAFKEEHWEEILQSDLWSNDEMVKMVLPVLQLSYDHLPLHLKHCFVYCSLFPRGHLFEKDQLVLLWLAQGFIEANERSKLEDVGGKYFDELVERSFFQYSPSHDLSEGRYVMHDLFHELAQSIAGHECSRIEEDKLCEVHEKARHSSLVPHESHSEKKIQFESFRGENLRSLLLVRRIEHNEVLFNIAMPNNIFIILESLRALDLSNTNIEELPNSIGCLIHLRYLGLRNTKVKRLPESIARLFKLQTLDLEFCRSFEELPAGTKLLSNLQHLKLPSKVCLRSVMEEFPKLNDSVDQLLGVSGTKGGVLLI